MIHCSLHHYDNEALFKKGGMLVLANKNCSFNWLQVCKLLQCCREDDTEQITKLCENGVPLLINFNEPENGDTALGVAGRYKQV